jgi:hypothetical protein
MRRTPFILAVLLLMMACRSSKQQLVGNDRDAHGCIGSAGYQWSELQQNCVRPFELPLIIKHADSITQIAVLFSADSSKAEVFAIEGHFMLQRKHSQFQSHLWKNNKMQLNKNESGNWIWEQSN